MNVDSESIVPARRPSGRLSKPSMELLVDNQRLLAQYIEPKKKRKVEIKKFVEEIGSQSNYSEKSSLSSTEKYKPKKKKVSLLNKNNDENDKVKIKVRKSAESTNEIKSDITNGGKHMDNGIQHLANETNLLNRTPYVSIEFNDMIIRSIKSPDKMARSPDKNAKIPDKIVRSPDKSGHLLDNNSDKSIRSPEKALKNVDKLVRSPEKPIAIPDVGFDVNDKSDDDLPLSKIYPDFKPRINESGEKRDTSVLPPKKKIKFININELNGSPDKQPLTQLKVPKLKLVFSPTKTSVMSMPKIPKKSTQINGSSDSENQSSPNRYSENVPISETNTVLTSTSPTPPVVHQTHIETTKRCIRPSCTNIAIEDFRWDKEFCSPDCAIMYSKFLFNEWLNQRRDLVVSE